MTTFTLMDRGLFYTAGLLMMAASASAGTPGPGGGAPCISEIQVRKLGAPAVKRGDQTYFGTQVLNVGTCLELLTVVEELPSQVVMGEVDPLPTESHSGNGGDSLVFRDIELAPGKVFRLGFDALARRKGDAVTRACVSGTAAGCDSLVTKITKRYNGGGEG